MQICCVFFLNFTEKYGWGTENVFSIYFLNDKFNADKTSTQNKLLSLQTPCKFYFHY